MLVVGVQKISRPMINLLVARFSLSKCEAAEVCILIAHEELYHFFASIILVMLNNFPFP